MEVQIQKAYERIWRKSEQPALMKGDISYLIELFHPVIVRDEYIKLWNYVKDTVKTPSMFRRGGLVVMGHPGVGTSSSLKHCLFMAFSQKIPVAFCNDPFFYWVADQDGWRKMFFNNSDYVFQQDGLVLVALNPGFRDVPAQFSSSAFASFVVAAMSPDWSEWYTWAREKNANFWIMPLWTRREVSLVQHFYDDLPEAQPCPWKDGQHYTPLELFDILGPCARSCFRSWSKSGDGHSADFRLSPDELFYRPTELETALKTGRTTIIAFHAFFYGLDSANSNPLMYPAFSYDIPTKFLRRLFAESVRRFNETTRMALAEALRPFPHLAWILPDDGALSLKASMEGNAVNPPENLHAAGRGAPALKASRKRKAANPPEDLAQQHATGPSTRRVRRNMDSELRALAA